MTHDTVNQWECTNSQEPWPNGFHMNMPLVYSPIGNKNHKQCKAKGVIVATTFVVFKKLKTCPLTLIVGHLWSGYFKGIKYWEWMADLVNDIQYMRAYLKALMQHPKTLHKGLHPSGWSIGYTRAWGPLIRDIQIMSLVENLEAFNFHFALDLEGPLDQRNLNKMENFIMTSYTTGECMMFHGLSEFALGFSKWVGYNAKPEVVTINEIAIGS
jgi:hypothetical protein